MTQPSEQPRTAAGGFDIRTLTPDQRSLADDIASAMGFGHEDGCAVWWEDPDGCSCPLLMDVAGGLHGARIVEVVQELGYDPATQRGDRLKRQMFDPHPLTEAAAPDPVASPARPRIVCICGSTRFAEHMNTLAENLTLAGMIVVRPEVIAYRRERDQQFVEPDVKAMLDELHFRKIDLADEVLVVTVDHYIGESTRREIDYARSIGKPVGFREYGPLADPVASPPEALRLLRELVDAVRGGDPSGAWTEREEQAIFEARRYLAATEEDNDAT